MKTKEIDVWVNSELINRWHCQEINNCKTTIHNLKAKLIIEIPEKKIEITESDLDRAYQVYFNNEESFTSGHFLKVIKKELGF